MTMTEDQIERRVEKMVDHLDRLLLAGQMTQADYDSNMRDLAKWADRKVQPFDGKVMFGCMPRGV